VHIKFLKFHTDVRPGYIGESPVLFPLFETRSLTSFVGEPGTWTKTSRTIGPRTPFGIDKALLNYDIDSEEEWEEEVEDPDAEDVNSGGERSDEEDADSDALSDDWMCADDEIEFEPGHDGEDEMRMDVDGDSDIVIMDDSTEARKRIVDREKKSKAAKEGAKKKKLVGPLLPLIKGPMWEVEIGETVYAPFESMKTHFLNGTFEVSFFRSQVFR
jgi:chromatin assembly factor 1 subunit A